MKLWTGIILFVLGCAVCVISFTFNAETPVQLGPIPVFGGAVIAVIGLILTVSAL